MSFTATGSGNNTNGWTHVLYQDSDCNGVLDDAEGGTILNTMNLSIVAGSSLCIINKVYAPSNTSSQDRYQVDTSAIFTYAGSTVPPATLMVTDLTVAGQKATSQAGESRLELTKTVENMTQGTAETEAVNRAAPGDVLRYRIAYRNVGSGPITDLHVSDEVPVYTEMVSGSNLCSDTPAGMSCTPLLNGEALRWGFTGSLVGGASGQVTFDVRLDN